MKTLKLLSAIGSIALILSGCAGKDGAPGATGPAGPAGVANISTTEYTVTPAQWTVVNAGVNYYTLLSVPAITNSNVDNIEVSFNFNNSSNWGLLPGSNYINVGDGFTVVYTNDEVEIDYFYSSSPAVTCYFNVTVIPPAAMKQHPNTNWHDLAQVKAIEDAQNMSKN
jgi:hypothetical protein